MIIFNLFNKKVQGVKALGLGWAIEDYSDSLLLAKPSFHPEGSGGCRGC